MTANDQRKHPSAPARHSFGITAALILLLILASFGFSSAAVHTASPGGNTINECIDLASAGDTIEIEAGGYTETVIVDKAVIIVGLQGSAFTTVTGADSDSDVITISVDGVDISGLTIENGRYGLAVSASVGSIQIADMVIGETGNAHLELPAALVSPVVAGATLVPHSDGEFNAVRILSSTIPTSTTWPALPGGFSYFLNWSTVTVGGAANPVLTIAPGAVVKGLYSYFMVGPDAGTPGGLMADNVVFTTLNDDTAGGNTSGNTNNPVASSWYHIRFQAGAIDGSCVLSNCDIRYGGRADGALWSRLGGTFEALNCTFEANGTSIKIEGGGESSVTNCTLAPQGRGVIVLEPCLGVNITGCTITQDSGYPAMLPMQTVNDFLNVQGNSYVPNGDNTFNAIGITNSSVTESMTLPVLPHGFVYFLDWSTVTVGGPSNPVLTIPSGTVIKGLYSYFNIGPNAGNPGGLMADNVVFTTLNDDTAGGNTSGNENAPSASSWYHIRFQAGAIDGSCVLSNCDIRYGGRGDAALWSRGGASFEATNCNFEANGTSVKIEGGGESFLTNCTLAPQGRGVIVVEPSLGVNVTDCTITQDSGFPAMLPMQTVDDFLNVRGNSYIPNGNNTFNAIGITNSSVTETMTLPVLPHNFVYFLDWSTVTVGGPSAPVLTIPSGTVIKGNYSYFMVGPDVGNPGGLMADNVVFTTLNDDTAGGNTSGNENNPSPSTWYHIRFQAGAIEGSCVLSNCEIRYGGRGDAALWSRYGGSFEATNCAFESNGTSVKIEGGRESTLANCTLAPVGRGVVVVEPSLGVNITGCTITQDSGFPAMLPMQTVDDFLNVRGNSYIPNGDNTFNAMGITSSTITESMTLPVLPYNFVYYLDWANVTVGGPDSPVLTIPSGMIIKGAYSQFTIGPDAENPGGLMADNVIFTALNDDTAGGNTSGNGNAPTPNSWYYIRFQGGAMEDSCILSNCDIRYGGRTNAVLWARNGGSFSALNCTLVDNRTSVRIEGGGEPVMTDCTLAPADRGLIIREPSHGVNISNCVITQGDDYPVLMPMNSVDGFLNVRGNTYIPNEAGTYNAMGITNTTITESMTLPVLPEDFVYYLDWSTVTVAGPDRPVLTIPAGTILKNFRSTFVFGQGTTNPGGIDATGAVFTSLRDNSVGGNTSGNSNAPAPADWYYLRFNEPSTIYNCKLIDCDLRYAGRSNVGTIYSRPGASLVLNAVRISHSSSSAVYAIGDDSRPRIYYCQLTDNVDGIKSENNGRPEITRSCFENNSNLAISVEEFTDGQGDLFAQECWWGDAAGPVVGTDVSTFVDYSNWATIATCVDLTPVQETPLVFRAMAPAPNPFNPSTKISFELPRAESVRLRIYDVRGGLVRELVKSEMLSAGNHSVIWNGRDEVGRSAPSGIYFYSLVAGAQEARHKMTLLK